MGESLQWDRPFIYCIPVQPTPCHRCCPSSPHSCLSSLSSSSAVATNTTITTTSPSSTSQHHPPPSSSLTDRLSSLVREITIWSVPTAAVPFQSVKSLGWKSDPIIYRHRVAGRVRLTEMAAATRAGIDTTGLLGMWPSEEAMACYLIAHAQRFRGRRVVELGAGYGLAGMALAVQQQGVGGVLLTDGNDTVVARLSRTVEANRHQFGGTRVAVAALRWDSHPPPHHWPPALSPPFDAVIAADCTFFKEHHEHLLHTITALLSPASPQPSSAPHCPAACAAALPTSQQAAGLSAEGAAEPDGTCIDAARETHTAAAAAAGAGAGTAGEAGTGGAATAAEGKVAGEGAAAAAAASLFYPPEAFLFAPHRGSSLALFLARVRQQGGWRVHVEEQYHEGVSQAFGEACGEGEEGEEGEEEGGEGESGEGQGLEEEKEAEEDERKAGGGLRGEVGTGEGGADRNGVEGAGSERRGGSEGGRRRGKEPWEGYTRMHDYPVMVHMTWIGQPTCT
ncbi:unnamed protein product [Closterium sp. Naga37s-1]|nr:unnamed protein product [Closterium sp. Naga37s-1]